MACYLHRGLGQNYPSRNDKTADEIIDHVKIGCITALPEPDRRGHRLITELEHDSLELTDKNEGTNLCATRTVGNGDSDVEK
jgi:hypothetical protein